MDTLNLDYDAEVDLLYASFGPPRPALSYHFAANDDLARVGTDGTMVGFDVFDLRRTGEKTVPLISGSAVGKDGRLTITPSTPWLHLRLRDGLLELWLDPDNIIVARGLVETDGGDPLIVDLSPLMARR